MKLISEYMNDDETSTSKVYYRKEKDYVVVVRSDSGTHYSSEFKSLSSAEDYAEDWIFKNE